MTARSEALPHIARLWREGRLYVWILSGTNDDWTVHFNGQSYWTTQGLRIPEGNFGAVLRRARECIDEHPNCLPRRRARRRQAA